MAEALPLALIHGSGDSHQAWDALCAHLPGVTCVTLDLPGHGARAGEPLKDGVSIAGYAADAWAQLASRGIERCVLGGHSLGSAIALRMAVDDPDMVAGVLLIGSGARLRVLPALLDAARNNQAATQAQMGTISFGGAHQDLAREYIAKMLPTTAGALYHDLAACNAFDMMAELPSITQPALVISGEEDKLTPVKYATYLSEHLPRATTLIIPGMGHYVQVEAPERVAQAIQAWLPGVPA
ncbi:MAG TPA: alpha/beta hydrolase [Ktedonobacterales bacterium]